MVGIAQAASFTYSEQSKQIRAGVLLLPNSSLNPAFRPNPYTFYVMDQRHDLKPAGWDFYNPFAPTHVTPAILSRWGTQYSPNESVTESMGCYWEVVLADTSPNDLAEYDVLLLASWQTLIFERRDREKLRKFVDNGGVLWVEYRQGGATGTRFDPTFFIQDLQFQTDGPGLAVPPVVPDSARAHSLLNRPFVLTWDDISKLGTSDPNVAGKVYVSDASGSNPPDQRYFISVITRQDSPIVSVAHYGSGFIVVTAESVGQAISEPVGLHRNAAGALDGRCGELFMAAHPEDLKFAYNIVSWGSEHTSFHKNARHTGYSFAEIGSPLTTLWEFVPEVLGPTASSPVILDDMIFYVDAGNVLHAFDLSPIRDRDMDGSPDEGIPDYSEGAQYDELWGHAFNEPVSSPTAGYVPIGGGTAVPAVFVIARSGKAYGFNALSPDPPVDLFELFPLKPFQPDQEIAAPTYVDGTLYAGDGAGNLHAQRFFPNPGEWTHPSPAYAPSTGPLANSPTVGCFYDPATGATDQVVYLAKRSIAGVSDGAVYSYPIRVHNEILTPAGTPGLFRIRSVNTPILETLGTWQLYYTTDGVNLFEIAAASVTIQQTGRFQIDPIFFATISDATIIADYELDYAHPQAGVTAFRQPILIHHPATGPGGVLEGAGVLSVPAASKKDLLYFASENGSLYAVRESGREQPPVLCKWRWCLKDPPVMAFLKATNHTDLEAVGSPAVAGDMVYFAVNNKANNQGYILALSADPTIIVNLGESIRRGPPVEVRQFDSMNPTVPTPVPFTGVTGDVGKVPGNASFLIDYEAGRLTFVNFRADGAATKELSASQDFTVVYTPEPSGQAQDLPEREVPFQAFDPRNDKWNNLVWRVELNDPLLGPLAISSSPMVMGDILYVGCENGVLCSMDVDKIRRAYPGPAMKVPLPLDPKYFWAKQLTPGSPIRATVAGSHGMLVVVTAGGLKVVHNPINLCTDADRIVETDVAGRVVWACDSTTSFVRSVVAQAAGGSPDEAPTPAYGAVKIPFNRPSVARRASIGGIIVADTGNNRIVHVDKGGNVLWQILDFADPGLPTDPNYPNAPLLPAGSPLTLNRPTDVSMWEVKPPDQDRPEYHYLIADSGNYRVLKVVARYDPVAGSYRNMLAWTSKTLAEGKQYKYMSARPILGPKPGYICAVSNYETKQGEIESTGGALVGLNPATGLAEVIPGLPLDSTAPTVKLVNPTFFNRQYFSNTEYYDVAIDATGIYVVHNIVDPVSGSVTSSIKSYKIGQHKVRFPTGEEFDAPLSPSYAQILPNGHVLVANKATGIVNGRAFFGEVFELKPSGAGYVLEGYSTLGLRQPSSAERQLY